MAIGKDLRDENPDDRSLADRVCGDKANTQAEMTAYTSDEAARVDAKLNATYQALLASVVSYLVGVLCFEVW